MLFSISELTQEGWKGQEMLTPGSPRHAARLLPSELLGCRGFTAGSPSRSSPSFYPVLFSMHFSGKDPAERQGAAIRCHPGLAFPTAPGTRCGEPMERESHQRFTREIPAHRLQLGQKTKITAHLGWEGAHGGALAREAAAGKPRRQEQQPRGSQQPAQASSWVHELPGSPKPLRSGCKGFATSADQKRVTCPAQRTPNFDGNKQYREDPRSLR